MGIVTDETAIQFRMLNRSKGPAMWSPRSQSDRTKFIATWRSILENTENLYIWQDSVNQVLVKDRHVTGVVTDMNVTFTAKCVVLTTGNCYASGCNNTQEFTSKFTSSDSILSNSTPHKKFAVSVEWSYPDTTGAYNTYCGKWYY